VLEGVIGAVLRTIPSAASALLRVIVVCAGAAGGAAAEQLPLWEAGLGATVISFPHYRGSDERRAWVLPFPYVVYRGEFLQADEKRMRGLFFKTERAELDVSVSGTPPVDSNENDARRGMPDLDATLEIGPSLNFLLARSDDRKTRLELRLPVRAVLATDFTHVILPGGCSSPTSTSTSATPSVTRGGTSACSPGRCFPTGVTTSISMASSPRSPPRRDLRTMRLAGTPEPSS